MALRFCKRRLEGVRADLENEICEQTLRTLEREGVAAFLGTRGSIPNLNERESKVFDHLDL
jgi:hypothetical protein